MDTPKINWNCTFDPPPSETKTVLSVGQTAGMKCAGPAVTINPNKAKIVVVGQDSHALQVWKINSLSADQADLVVVSYKVGDYENNSVIFSDDNSFVQLQGLKWTVKSVIDIKSGQPEPFGPYGPWYIPWPWWYFAIACSILVLLLGLVYRQIKKALALRIFKKNVKDYRAKFDPFDQFQKETRVMRRRLDQGEKKFHEILEELQSSFQRYLTMELIVFLPVGASERWIASAIKKRLPHAKEEIHKDLYLLLSEFSRSKKEDLKQSEVEHILTWAQDLSEKMDDQ